MTDRPSPDITSLLPDDAAIDARRRALEAELRPTPRRPRRQVRRLALAVLAVLALGGGVAWATGVFSADEIAVDAGVGCYEEPSLHADAAIFRSAVDPVAKCARLWREGALGLRLDRLEREGRIEPRPDPRDPHLVACSAPGRPVLVFPGPDGLCDRLGLQPLPADYPGVGREVARAYAAWDRVLRKAISVDPGACRPPGEVAEQARSLLAKTRYGDVGVVVGGRGPCASRIEADGRFIRVSATTRSAGRSASIQQEVIATISPLAVRANRTCIAPATFRSLLRTALDRAGLEAVKAIVRRPTAPCVAGGFGASPESVSFAGIALKAWKETRARLSRRSLYDGKAPPRPRLPPQGIRSLTPER